MSYSYIHGRLNQTFDRSWWFSFHKEFWYFRASIAERSWSWKPYWEASWWLQSLLYFQLSYDMVRKTMYGKNRRFCIYSWSQSDQDIRNTLNLDIWVKNPLYHYKTLTQKVDFRSKINIIKISYFIESTIFTYLILFDTYLYCVYSRLEIDLFYKSRTQID